MGITLCIRHSNTDGLRFWFEDNIVNFSRCFLIINTISFLAIMEISCVKYSITTGWRKLWNAIRIKYFGKFWFGNNISDFSRCERYGFRTFEMVILSTELNCESKCWVNTWKPLAMELAKGFRNRLHIGWTGCCNSSGSLGVLSWLKNFQLIQLSLSW